MKAIVNGKIILKDRITEGSALLFVLGIAMGTSETGGYVDPQGNITGRLNELAFVPVDFCEDAMVDEWSGDYGCGVKYFSQDGVIKQVLIMVRVTSGESGVILLERAQEVLGKEFPELSEKIKLHIPDESSKRVGQSFAAASLPELK